MKKPEERILKCSGHTMVNEYAVLKVMASVLVVIGHVTVFYTYDGGVVPMEPNRVLDGVMRLLYSFHMPLFMFVSGAVYHQCISAGKYQEIGSFIVKKAKRLMLPYLAWGILYVTPVMVLLGFTEQAPISYIVDGILCSNNSRHLWFLWALFVISAGGRLIQPLAQRGKPWQAVLLAVLLAAWYLSWRVSGPFQIQSILRYGLWYELGYLSNEQKPRMDRVLRGSVWVPLVSLLILVFCLLSKTSMVTRLASASAGIMLCYWIALHWNRGLCGTRVYQILERDSFGIYLAHPMIIYACFYFFQGIMHNPYLTSIVVTLVALIGSVALTEALRALRLKAVLGE